MDIDVLRQRFEAKTMPVPPATCLLWVGSVNPGGYGKMLVSGRLRQATHVAFFLKYGRWPQKGDVRHECDTPECVLPDHLLEGTRFDNMRDMRERGRAPVGERHGMAKLSDEQSEGVRQAQGETAAIAYWYGISAAQVNRIKNGRSRTKKAGCAYSF